jgi:hypothetical protein
MQEQVSEAARELLELERRWQTGSFDEPEAARWYELAVLVFGDEDSAHRRRSFRLTANVPVMLKMGSGIYEGTIVEVSRLGLAIAGAAFGRVTHEDSIDLLDFTLDGVKRPLNMTCEIVRLDIARKPLPVAGVSVDKSNPKEVGARFFEDLYYPLYISNLEHLAKGAHEMKAGS